MKAIDKDLFSALNSNQVSAQKWFLFFFFWSLHWKLVDNNDVLDQHRHISLSEITLNLNSIGQLILYRPDCVFLPYFNNELSRGRSKVSDVLQGFL